MRGACNTKARGDNKKSEGSKKSCTQGPSSPSGRPQQTLLVQPGVDPFLASAVSLPETAFPVNMPSLHKAESDEDVFSS